MYRYSDFLLGNYYSEEIRRKFFSKKSYRNIDHVYENYIKTLIKEFCILVEVWRRKITNQINK
jgi:hypothetical protein